MKITVVITTLSVPFDQVVTGIKSFDNEVDAVTYINAQSAAWYTDLDGDRCCQEYPNTKTYKPIIELGYDLARYVLWDGEQFFHAMIDEDTYSKLHEAHYKREFDDKGLPRPGYLQVAELLGGKP